MISRFDSFIADTSHIHPNTSVFRQQVHSVTFQPNLFAASLAVGSSVSLIVNVGLDSCETIAVSDNRPMLSTYHQSPVGIRNILQAIVQATGNNEITLDSLLKVSFIIVVFLFNSRFPISNRRSCIVSGPLRQ